MKIAIITCYFDPDYVRARTLRAALKNMPGVKMIVLKNKNKGVLRYPEMLWKILRLRFREKPDVYLLTFRGQEILQWVLWVAGKKPVIFDEFIIPILSATNENHAKTFVKRVHRSLAKASVPLYKYWLRKCRFILADTPQHAELSARTSDMNIRKYVSLPVGADETLFKPATNPKKSQDVFEVFYYGNMLPHQGLDIMLEAVELLKDHEDITFRFVGGKKTMQQRIRRAMANGARIEYEKWMPFQDLPAAMHRASLCLGGHFGDSQQAQHTIPGKVYQMLACQEPVVVGASIATQDYFIDQQNSLVVQQGNAQGIVNTILWAKEHPKELDTVAEKGRKLYEKEFSTVAIARRLQPVVDALS